MRQLVVLLGFFGIALAVPLNFTVPIPDLTIGGRIVGGEEADIRDLPYLVALLRNGAQICGGSIIASDLVLTAAHCVESRVISAITQLNVRVGSSQWREGGQRIAALEIIIHEQYNSNSLDFDIALIKLVEPVQVPNAEAVALAGDLEYFPAGIYGTVSGWGVTSSGATTSPETLRRVDVPVVDEERCRSVYGSIISSRTICAGYTLGGRDACQGDSGGPYVIEGRLAGIVSFGVGCALPLFPGVYASVGGLRGWVRDNSGI